MPRIRKTVALDRLSKIDERKDLIRNMTPKGLKVDFFPHEEYEVHTTTRVTVIHRRTRQFGSVEAPESSLGKVEWNRLIRATGLEISKNSRKMSDMVHEAKLVATQKALDYRERKAAIKPLATPTTEAEWYEDEETRKLASSVVENIEASEC